MPEGPPVLSQMAGCVAASPSVHVLMDRPLGHIHVVATVDEHGGTDASLAW